MKTKVLLFRGKVTLWPRLYQGRRIYRPRAATGVWNHTEVTFSEGVSWSKNGLATMRPTRFAILVLGALLFGGSTYWMLPSQHVHVYNNNNKPPPPPPRNGTTATPTVALALDPATGAHQALVQLRLHNCNFLTTPSLPTTTPASCLTSESCHINEFCHHELHTCNTNRTLARSSEHSVI